LLRDPSKKDVTEGCQNGIAFTPVIIHFFVLPPHAVRMSIFFLRWHHNTQSKKKVSET
jgi:hypothetical protein